MNHLGGEARETAGAASGPGAHAEPRAFSRLAAGWGGDAGELGETQGRLQKLWMPREAQERPRGNSAGEVQVTRSS